MVTFSTLNRHGYSVCFSPFNHNNNIYNLAVASSAFFGLTGAGTLFILNIENEQINLKQSYQWSSGLFDVIWSEINPSNLITASSDGVIQLWNLNKADLPLSVFHEHQSDVSSLDWSKTRQDQWFLSGSWDSTIKLWNPNRRQSLNTFTGHCQLVHCVMFAPLKRGCFASVSGDGSLKLWSCDMPSPAVSFRAHDAEIISCDWCKYDENIVASSASDGLIRIWDIRDYKQPLSQLKGGEYAVKRIKFSPYDYSILASVDYGFKTKIWDFNKTSQPLETINHHSEFVYGLDWNIHKKGELADCGWDGLVNVFTPNSLKHV